MKLLKVEIARQPERGRACQRGGSDGAAGCWGRWAFLGRVRILYSWIRHGWGGGGFWNGERRRRREEVVENATAKTEEMPSRAFAKWATQQKYD